MFPELFREEIKELEIKQRSKISETEEKRQKLLHNSLVTEKEISKKIQQNNRPLGKRHRIRGNDRQHFQELIEDITGVCLENTLKQKPLQWRNFIVRTVFSAKDKKGEDVRNLCVKVYTGDLKWGVRDARLLAEKKNWPKMDGNAYLRNQDRNSWIASSFMKALQIEAKSNVKKKYFENL